MNLQGWDTRYRSGERQAEDAGAHPTPLVQETASRLSPGTALDLAAGTGRNSIWLAERGWQVTAVDGAPAAIEILNSRTAAAGLQVRTETADLTKGAYLPPSESFDLVLICYYLQRNLFRMAKEAVRSGSTLLAIVHITKGSEESTAPRLKPGELREYFDDWRITHYYEGKPRDTAHKRAVAEIVAQRSVGA